MAKVDYYGIELAIQQQLRNWQNLANALVCVEEEGSPSIIEGPTILIYLDSRSAPITQQAISAGRITRFNARFSIWCHVPNFEERALACRDRDALIGEVELAIMSDRSLNGTVGSCWIEGGSFETGRRAGGAGYVAGGEIVLVADVKAIS